MAKSNEHGDGRKRLDGRLLAERAKKLLSAGDETSVAEAVRCLDAAVELGCVEACCLRGMAYLAGAGGVRSERDACEMFKRGKEAGDPLCCMELFRCLISGLGCSRDDDEAMACLREAADRDLPEALYLLGACEICAFRAERDVADGIAQIARAAVLGCEDAREALERMGSDPGSLAPGAPSKLSDEGVAALRDGEMRMAAAALAGRAPASEGGIQWLKWSGMAKRLGSDKAPVALDAAGYLDFATSCKNTILCALERERAEAARTGSGKLPLKEALGDTVERINRFSIEIDMIMDDISLSPSGDAWDRKWDSVARACLNIREECAKALEILDDRRNGGTG